MGSTLTTDKLNISDPEEVDNEKNDNYSEKSGKIKKMTAKDKRKRFMVRKVAKVMDSEDDEKFDQNSEVDLND